MDRFRAIAILVGPASFVLLIVGGSYLTVDRRSGPTIVIDDPRADATIVVAVEGAVASPGPYGLPGGARVQDALNAAGGAREDADLAAFNLARRLVDEERLIVPTKVSRSNEVGTPLSLVTFPTATSAAGGKIDINIATAAELETLPKIGPKRAAAIVAYRTAHGPFRTIEELAAVEGISPEMVEELRPFITVS